VRYETYLGALTEWKKGAEARFAAQPGCEQVRKALDDTLNECDMGNGARKECDRLVMMFNGKLQN
jgi:hypothetical protein